MKTRLPAWLRLIVAAIVGVTVHTVAWSAPPTDPLLALPDGNSVELINDVFILNYPTLSIGASKGGLTWQMKRLGGFVPFDNFSQHAQVGATGDVTITLFDRSVFFTPSPTFGNEGETGETLSYNSATLVYTFVDRDGTKYIFYPNDGNQFDVDPVNKIIDPNGTVTTITREPYANDPTSTNIASVNNSNGYQLKYTYDSTIYHLLLKVTAINNAVEYCDPAATTCSLVGSWPSVTMTYDSNNQVSTMTDPLNRVIKLGSSPNGFTIQYPAHTSPNVTIGYVSDTGSVSSVVVGGQTWTYNEPSPGVGDTMTVTDPLGHTEVLKIALAYGRKPASITDGNGHTTSYTYDLYQRLTQTTYPEGNYDQYYLDGRGNVTQTTKVSKTPGTPANIIIAANFDTTCANAVKCNQPNWTKSPLGDETDYAYDPTSGLLTSITKPAPTTGAVRPQSRTSYTQRQAYYLNSSGTLVASGVPTWLPTGTSECQTLSSCVGSSDEVKGTIVYGTAGTANNLLPTSKSKGSGDGVLVATTTTAYDKIGNLYTVDGPLPGTADTTRYRFDAARQMTGVVLPDPDGGGPLKYRATRTTYDLDGHVIRVDQGTVASQSDTDWTGFATLLSNATSYDSSDRKIEDSVLSSAGVTQSVTQYSYDSASRLDCTAVRMNSAAFGSLPSSACTAGAVGSYGPDRISKNGYDSANQLTSVTDAYGIAGTQRITFTKTYSNNGKLKTVADALNNFTTNTYDGFDRLVKTQYPSPTTAGSSSTTDYETYGYDANGNRLSWRLRDATSIIYGYDHLDRNTSKTLPVASNNANQLFGYDNLNRKTSASNANGTSTSITFGYDALSRKTREVSTFSGGAAHTKTLQYDLAGRCIQLNWPDSLYLVYDYLVTGEMLDIRENGATSGVGVLATFGYDNLGRRNTLTRGNGTLAATGTSYSYDAAGRLGALNNNNATAAIDYTFTYNPADQLTSRAASNGAYAWTQGSNANISYTSNGLNQYTVAGSVSPTYDARGNLTNAGSQYTYNSLNELTSYTGGTYFYDALDRLTESSSASMWFDHEDTNLITEYDNSFNVLRRYVFGPSTDEPLVWYEGSGTASRRWLHADERGSVVLITDSTGAVFAKNAYDEYGTPQSTNVGRFQYTGQAMLPEIGMYDYKARVYSPNLGRFMQTDPVGYKDSYNLYEYAANDPLDKTDPSGKCILGILGGDCQFWASVASALTSAQAAIAPIFGKAQTSVNTPTHASTSERIANQQAQKPDTKEVHLNRNLQKITGDKGMPNQRPDVTTVNKDDTISRTEVRSSGQTTQELQDKLSGSRGALGGRAGADTVVEPDMPTVKLPEGVVPVRVPEVVMPIEIIP
jgi:RHS repeat-associated protein